MRYGFSSRAASAQTRPMPSRVAAVCASRLPSRDSATTATPMARVSALKTVEMISRISVFHSFHAWNAFRFSRGLHPVFYRKLPAEDRWFFHLYVSVFQVLHLWLRSVCSYSLTSDAACSMVISLAFSSSARTF